MLTVTKEEHEDYLIESKMELANSGKHVLAKLKKGCDISNAKHFRNMNSLVASIEYYKTGDFNPEEFFNVQTSDDIIKTYSNAKQLRHGT